MARAKLTSMQLGALAEALKTTGPMEAGRLIDAFIQTQPEKEGLLKSFVSPNDVSFSRGNSRRGFKETEGSHFGSVAEVLVQIAGVGKSYGVRACGRAVAV